MNKVELQSFAGGALQENFQKAIEEVIKNLQNPNTPWKNKRSITIKVSFNQNEERDDSSCEVSVNTTLAPIKPIVTSVAIGKDLKTGEVFAEEYGKQVRGQMTIGDIKCDNDGVIIEEESETNVIDLRRNKA